jgi:hypothetical protein
MGGSLISGRGGVLSFSISSASSSRFPREFSTCSPGSASRGGGISSSTMIGPQSSSLPVKLESLASWCVAEEWCSSSAMAYINLL